MTIIYCLIANILTLAAIAGVGYYFYKKNEAKISETVTKLKETIDMLKGGVEDIAGLKGKLDELLGKFPFAVNNKKTEE